MTILSYHYEDHLSRLITPGTVTWMYDSTGITQKNVIGAVGKYSITVHIEGNAAPDNTIFYTVVRRDSSGNLYPNYVQYAGTLSGGIFDNAEFKVTANSGDQFWVRLSAISTNSGNVAINKIDVDSYLIS